MLDDTEDTENTNSDTSETPCEVPAEIEQRLKKAEAERKRLLRELGDTIGKMLGE